MAIDVLEHVPQYETWFKKISSLAPRIVLHVPLDLSLRSVLSPQLLERERQSVGHIHFFTARRLKRFLQQNGCQILSAHYTNKYVECPPALPRLKSRIGMAIRRLAHRLCPWGSALLLGGYSETGVSKCFLPAFLWVNLPVAVLRKRFLPPAWFFNLGIFLFLLFNWLLFIQPAAGAGQAPNAVTTKKAEKSV